MPYCSACGEELGPPNETMWDPEVDEASNKQEAAEAGFHIQLIKSEKGERFQCLKKGTFTKVVDEPPNSGGGKESKGKDKADSGPPSGATGSQPQNQSPPQPQAAGPVFDMEEEKEPMDILNDVVANPAYELSNSQVEEVMSWGEMYDGQMPSDALEQLLSNLKGISNQKAKLMRQKYEIMLNKWVRERSTGTGGPSLGGGPNMPFPPAGVHGGQHGGQAPTGVQGGTPGGPNGESPDGSVDESGGPVEERAEDVADMRSERRKRRFHRRQDAIDEAAEEMARNMAEDMGRMYSDVRMIITTVLKRKAEQDPDWFLEKADSFGLDIIDQLSEPSNAKREQMENGGGAPQVDNEIDSALEDMMNEPSEPQETEEPDTPKSQPPQDHPMKGQPPQPEGDDDDEDASFEEIMGSMED